MSHFLLTFAAVFASCPLLTLHSCGRHPPGADFRADFAPVPLRSNLPRWPSPGERLRVNPVQPVLVERLRVKPVPVGLGGKERGRDLVRASDSGSTSR